MFDVLKTILGMSWTLVKIPLFIFSFFAVIFFVMFLWGCFQQYRSGKRLIKGEWNPPKKRSILKAVFWDAPRQYAVDYFNRNPEHFRYKGIVVFTGRQGYGKTIAMIEQVMRFQEEYPKLKVIGNCDYKYQDAELNHWMQLISYNNGKQGVCVLMDEMQNWFSSNQSKNFPPEMLEVCTQNRKNSRIILGTSQVFTRLSKPLREQATEVRECFTLFGCLTIVHRLRLKLDSEGNVESRKHIGFYCFAHTPEIRSAYDTYKVIESLAKSGFQERQPEQAKTVVNLHMGK